MTSFTEIIEKCGICGTFTKHMVMLSTNSFGSPDLDLRPPGMERRVGRPGRRGRRRAIGRPGADARGGCA